MWCKFNKLSNQLILQNNNEAVIRCLHLSTTKTTVAEIKPKIKVRESSILCFIWWPETQLQMNYNVPYITTFNLEKQQQHKKLSQPE